MSVKDGKDYLYLIWKSEQTRKQYIIGQLTKNGQYEFQYSEEVQSAIADGFKPLLCFPDLNKVY
ncbi:MAG: DNA-binding protein, partial [Lachnospiraceae bacterium]|nr:DNA-binding protein [Lachnospiraceae bacterium]